MRVTAGLLLLAACSAAAPSPQPAGDEDAPGPTRDAAPARPRDAGGEVRFLDGAAPSSGHGPDSHVPDAKGDVSSSLVDGPLANEDADSDGASRDMGVPGPPRLIEHAIAPRQTDPAIERTSTTGDPPKEYPNHRRLAGARHV